MKGKKYTIGLLILVMLIWGTVAYKLLKPKKDEWEGVVYQKSNIEFIVDSLRLDTLPLKFSYKDPFLKYNKYASRKTQSSSTNITPIQRQAIARKKLTGNKRSRLRWPKLEYNGLMKDAQKTIGFLSIEAQSEIVTKGTIVHEIEVIEIYIDSIQLKFKTEYKTINKSKK